jgi:UDP-N-acetylglucosamine 2-epimerase (non-hydrolysing)/GDP/UDP-N,N'-diacetylbacillosamine 2-epimerase (hydrolysing)
MTKLAHLHFTTNEDSMRRVLRLGEEPWRVFNVGFPAIDLIMRGDYASKDEVATKLDIDFERPIVVFTQHSITIEPQMARQQMQQCIQAIRQLISMGIQVILTYPNNDDGSSEMIEEIEDLRKESQENIRINKSLGRYMYHGVLALSKLEEVRLVCAGNSSSGIKETPAFGCPTVNIGSRQSSRLRGENVIDAVCEAPDIFEKIKVGLFDEKFRATCKMTSNPYYLGGASRKIVEVLSTVELSKKLLRKKMTY